MSEGSELVFVYGTLRKGASNHWRVAGAGFVGDGTVAGRLYCLGWYPGLLLEAGVGEVRGEVYRVGPEKLAELDRFEGCGEDDPTPHEYRRVRVVVAMAEGAMEAWAWEFVGDLGEREFIASGDWLNR